MARKTYWEMEVRHDGLGKYRHIRGSNKYVVEQKAYYQQVQWDEQWQRKIENDQRKLERVKEAEQRKKDVFEKEQQRLELLQEKERVKQQVASEKARKKEEAQRYKDERKQEAEERDSSAKDILNTLRNTLAYTLKVNDAIDWNLLKDTSKFKERPPELVLPPLPKNPPIPSKPIPNEIPPKPASLLLPSEPNRTLIKYQPDLGVLDKF